MKLTDDQRAELEAVLNREGCAPGSSLHSWRCEDKDRYPEPCDCVAGVVDELAPLIEGWSREAQVEAWGKGFDAGYEERDAQEDA